MVFPNLISLDFDGDLEYLEDILSSFKTPILKESGFHLFNQLVFDAPLLGHFIWCTETFMTIHKACVKFFTSAVWVTLLGREEMAYSNREALKLRISCKPLDWQLSAVTQVLNSLLPSLPTLESLEITVIHKDWQGQIEVTQCQEFLHPFTSVKEMTLVHKYSVQLVAPALRELASEGATEVLPALQNIFLMTFPWRPSGLIKEAIEHFVATRRLYGQPVIDH